MAIYRTFNYSEEEYGAAPPLPPVMQERIPWLFQALNDPDIYEFAVNPLEATLPDRVKAINSQGTTHGAHVLFQGRDQVPSITFSGTILHQAQYEKMLEWFNVSKQVMIKDDLGNLNWVYLSSYNPRRTPANGYPWMTEYSAEATILSWS